MLRESTNSARNVGMKIAVLGASLLILLCGQALARPRDNVMAGAYRCSAHVSTRVWLDCYYGAAQPQRAALGLSPAPAAQVKLTEEAPAPGVPQDIAARDQVMAAAGRCAGMGEDRPWLDCYYAAANPVRGLLGLPLMPGAAPPPAPIPVSGPAPMPGMGKSNPGWFGQILGMPNVKVTARMDSYSFHHDQHFTVTLANGQVWEQTDGDTQIAHWKKDPRLYTVIITGGAFGSYNLNVKDSAGRYKVRRVS
jgi:hypothetical protein